MKGLVNLMGDLITNHTDIYALITSILLLYLLLISMYNKIKYLCLEKAAEKVAAVENITNLTGEEKFALAVLWINHDLPAIFRNSLIQSLISKLVQYAYDKSSEYSKNYIKRKTGYDISTLIDKLDSTIQEQAKDTNSGNYTSN